MCLWFVSTTQVDYNLSAQILRKSYELALRLAYKIKCLRVGVAAPLAPQQPLGWLRWQLFISIVYFTIQLVPGRDCKAGGLEFARLPLIRPLGVAGVFGRENDWLPTSV